MITISVIIPCFNHGLFVRDAVKSVEKIKKISFEIIIVNDGSTDEHTIQVLSKLEKDGIIVIHQKNMGLATARNTGILNSRGKYILPLDADNLIKADYILKAVRILEKNQADIVYAEPEFFGEINPIRFFHPKEFDINEIFFGNYIDACAVYRRNVWELTGGYDVNMPFPGHEDWEFWINAYKYGFKFVYLKEKLFYYRVCNNSMIVKTTKTDKENFNHRYIVNKHFDIFLNLNSNYWKLKEIRKNELGNPFRSALRFFLLSLKNIMPKF